MPEATGSKLFEVTGSNPLARDRKPVHFNAQVALVSLYFYLSIAWARAFHARSKVGVGGVASSKLASKDLLAACLNLEIACWLGLAWPGLGLACIGLTWFTGLGFAWLGLALWLGLA